VDPPIQLGTYVPYYLPVLVVVGLLSWILALRIATPLRDLMRVVDRFGRGELSVRMNSRRRDEFGELGNAFDRMAERIGTLLTAERQLLQDISHELRTPLTRLSFAAELTRTAAAQEGNPSSDRSGRRTSAGNLGRRRSVVDGNGADCTQRSAPGSRR
jgi:two-component system sensor histidine kinase CpxA